MKVLHSNILKKKYIRKKDLEGALSSFNEIGWLVVGSKADSLTRDLGLWVDCPPWGVFLRDPSRIYACFGENHGKLRTARSTSATGD